jgi:hypothetical protein
VPVKYTTQKLPGLYWTRNTWGPLGQTWGSLTHWPKVIKPVVRWLVRSSIPIPIEMSFFKFQSSLWKNHFPTNRGKIDSPTAPNLTPEAKGSYELWNEISKEQIDRKLELTVSKFWKN